MPQYYIGSKPIRELGPLPDDPNFEFDQKIQCTVFIAQLKRTFADMPDSISLYVTMLATDHGNFREVTLCCPRQDDLQFATHVITHLPTRWDDEALDDLRHRMGNL